MKFVVPAPLQTQTGQTTRLKRRAPVRPAEIVVSENVATPGHAGASDSAPRAVAALAGEKRKAQEDVDAEAPEMSPRPTFTGGALLASAPTAPTDVVIGIGSKRTADVPSHQARRESEESERQSSGKRSRVEIGPVVPSPIATDPEAAASSEGTAVESRKRTAMAAEARAQKAGTRGTGDPTLLGGSSAVFGFSARHRLRARVNQSKERSAAENAPKRTNRRQRGWRWLLGARS